MSTMATTSSPSGVQCSVLTFFFSILASRLASLAATFSMLCWTWIFFSFVQTELIEISFISLTSNLSYLWYCANISFIFVTSRNWHLGGLFCHMLGRVAKSGLHLHFVVIITINNTIAIAIGITIIIITIGIFINNTTFLRSTTS